MPARLSFEHQNKCAVAVYINIFKWIHLKGDLKAAVYHIVYPVLFIALLHAGFAKDEKFMPYVIFGVFVLLKILAYRKVVLLAVKV